jgi:hypothetical protein
VRNLDVNDGSRGATCEEMRPKGIIVSLFFSIVSVSCSAKCQHDALNWLTELYSQSSFGCG